MSSATTKLSVDDSCSISQTKLQGHPAETTVIATINCHISAILPGVIIHTSILFTTEAQSKHGWSITIEPAVSAFLKAVALNNQGWINFELGYLETSRPQYESLMEFLQDTTCRGYWLVENQALIDQFMVNSMFIECTHVALAAN